MFSHQSPMDRITSGAATMTAGACQVVEELIASREAIRTVSGVSVEVWLTAHTRLPRMERLALQVAADVLPAMHGVRARFASGAASWPVVRVITRRVARLRSGEQALVDARMAAAIDHLADADAERVLEVLDLVMAELRPDSDRAKERRLEQGEFVALQPFLDGSGGSIYAQYGAVNFAAVSDGIIDASPRVQLDANPHGDPHVAADNGRSLGKARAEGLLALCTRATDGTPARPKILATVQLETLLQLNKASGHLLTQLLGGKMRVTATAARRLASGPDGCDLRLIVIDEEGQSVGVGRSKRLPPDWLRDAVLAVQPVSTFPASRQPARLADLDHAKPWEDQGRTDSANLAPTSRGEHTPKTNGQWDVTRRDDQSTTWTNTLTGLTLTQPSLWTLQQLAAGTHPATKRRRAA